MQKYAQICEILKNLELCAKYAQICGNMRSTYSPLPKSNNQEKGTKIGSNLNKKSKSNGYLPMVPTWSAQTGDAYFTEEGGR